MATSKDYMSQLEGMGSMPDYKNVIADAYNNPVLKPIVQETQDLESQYLPTMFDTFASTGTGAGDMSAAAKLAKVWRSLGNITSRAGNSRDIQNFYNTQIGGLANTASQDWQMKQQKLKDLQQMAFQGEEAARQEAARKAAAAAARAQMDTYNNSMGGGGPTEDISQMNVGLPTSFEEFNALRQAHGKDPIPRSYYDSTVAPGVMRNQGKDPYAPTWQDNIGNAWNTGKDAYGRIKGVNPFGDPMGTALNIGSFFT